MGIIVTRHNTRFGQMSSWAFVAAVLSVALYLVTPMEAKLTDPAGPTLEPQAVIILHRHTARYPFIGLEIAPFIETSYERGIARSTFLGLELSEAVADLWQSWYPTLLDGSDIHNVFARASASPRCFETAQALLSRLYSRERFNPVPIVNPPPGHDQLQGGCIEKETMDPIDVEMIVPNNTFGFRTVADVQNFLQTKFEGEDVRDMRHVYSILDGLVVLQFNRSPLPDWAKDPFWVECEAEFYPYFKRPNLPLASHLVAEIGRRIQNIAHGLLNTTLNFFSFHDLSLDAMRSSLSEQQINDAFNETANTRRSFLAAYFFELHLNPSVTADYDRMVHVFYSNGLSGRDNLYLDRMPVAIPACGGSNRCPVNVLVEILMKNPLLKDLQEMCGDSNERCFV